MRYKQKTAKSELLLQLFRTLLLGYFPYFMVAQKGTKFVAAHLEKLSVFLDSVNLTRSERYSSLLEGLQLDEQGCLLSTRK